PHDRRPRRGAASSRPRFAAAKPHPAAALPQQGVLTVRAGTAGRLPRRLNLRGIFTHDVPLKLAAILIAILFAIGSAQNAAPRELTLQFDGRVPVDRPELPTGVVLRGNLGDVSVTLRGPVGVVARLPPGDLHTNLDLAGLDDRRAEH